MASSLKAGAFLGSSINVIMDQVTSKCHGQNGPACATHPCHEAHAQEASLAPSTPTRDPGKILEKNSLGNEDDQARSSFGLLTDSKSRPQKWFRICAVPAGTTKGLMIVTLSMIHASRLG